MHSSDSESRLATEKAEIAPFQAETQRSPLFRPDEPQSACPSASRRRSATPHRCRMISAPSGGTPSGSASSERARCNCAGVAPPAAIWLRAQARSSRPYAHRAPPATQPLVMTACPSRDEPTCATLADMPGRLPPERLRTSVPVCQVSSRRVPSFQARGGWSIQIKYGGNAGWSERI